MRSRLAHHVLPDRRVWSDCIVCDGHDGVDDGDDDDGNEVVEVNVAGSVSAASHDPDQYPNQKASRCGPACP